MKSTGVVRKVDELGRIVLPISIRQTMDINEKIPWRSLLTKTASSCKNTIPHAYSVTMPTALCTSTTSASARIVWKKSRPSCKKGKLL